jgi:hypothetical protein
MALDWVGLGVQAQGLVVDGRIGVVVYWSRGDLGVRDDPVGEPVVIHPGFYAVPVDRPDYHAHLLDSDETDPDQGGNSWAHARFLAEKRLDEIRGDA